jgi:hypothetical protein
VARHLLAEQRDSESKIAEQRGENYKNGRERPHFSGFQPPKKFWGRSRPGHRVVGARRFPRCGKPIFGVRFEGGTMPIVKKQPAVLTREVRMEEPVSALLDDYAQFIESSPDHVVNAVLKKTLWRDQDYRKWREQRRTRSTEIQAERATKS